MISSEMLLETTRDLKVLFVEDDSDLCLATQNLLSLYFSQVDIAYDGKEGFEKYSAYKKLHGYNYDIVLTDINMPVMNGLDMAREILKVHESQSIIILTAHNSQEYLYESITLGIDGFMSKPIDNDQLFKTIFKISQAINDHKMIEDYMHQVEELNAELQDSNSALILKNKELEKSLRMLDTVISKEEIIRPKVDEIESTPAEQEDIKNQILQLINDDLFELKEILTEIDVTIIDTINNLENIPDENIELLVKHFSRYASILHYYTFFNELSLGMSDFSQMMRTTQLPNSEENVRNIFTFLETFVYVLSKWHNDLSSGDESKINQFDASIISDMATIKNMWIQTYDDNINEEDLDDIFDF